MSSKNALKEFMNSKSNALFWMVYGIVLIGIMLSAVYVSSAIYSSDSAASWSSSRHSQHVTPSSPNTTLVSPALNKLRPIWKTPPPGSEMLPLETFRLTKELVQERVKDNVIVVTFGNYAFMDFILTWVKHLTSLGVENLVVGAMDTQLLESLYWEGVPVFDMGSHMSTIDVAGWMSPTFHKIGREKVILIDSMLQFGYEILLCDSDAVWLKNPLSYIARYPDADILTSTDQITLTVTDDRLDNWQQVRGAYNIGFFHWRPTDSAKRLAKEWKEMVLVDDKIWDQIGFNNLVRKKLGPFVDNESGLVYAYDGTLKLGLLPVTVFCNGNTYFIQAMYQQLRLEPYVVHTTMQYAGSEGKRHRLREAMLFYDPPEYYNPPGGFFTFKPLIPKSLLIDGEHNLETHFNLVNYQIKQIRTALAITFILNRTLVMPPIWCRLDRLWFPHPGIPLGSMTRQPFICPLDHVFEVNTMLGTLPIEEFGPGINIREYSFFDNPLMPAWVKDSWVDVELCQENCQSNITNTTTLLKFPRHSDEETLKTVFSKLKDVKVIRFSTMQDAFIGFTDKILEEKFRKRVKRYVGMYCCVENHTPGHVYYDMYWDEKPDWKPLPPQTQQDDHPHW